MKFIFCLCLSIFLFLLAGCGKQAALLSQPSSGPILYTVTDATGAELSFCAKPKRIVSFGLSVDEILLDTVAPSRIAALTHLADNPAISCVADKASLVKERVVVTAAESVVALKPDLIIMPDWLEAQIVENLRSLGIPVYIYHTPTTLEEIEVSIRQVTAATGDSAAGEELIDKMRWRLAAVRRMVRALTPQERRSVVALSQMGAFGAKGTTFDDLCTKANVVNALATIDLGRSSNPTREQIVALNPDAFLMPDWDSEGSGGKLRAYKEEIMHDSAYQFLPAIREGRVLTVPNKYIYSTTHYAAYAVESIARRVYPELF